MNEEICAGNGSNDSDGHTPRLAGHVDPAGGDALLLTTANRCRSALVDGLRVPEFVNPATMTESELATARAAVGATADRHAASESTFGNGTVNRRRLLSAAAAVALLGGGGATLWAIASKPHKATVGTDSQLPAGEIRYLLPTGGDWDSRQIEVIPQEDSGIEVQVVKVDGVPLVVTRMPAWRNKIDPANVVTLANGAVATLSKDASHRELSIHWKSIPDGATEIEVVLFGPGDAADLQRLAGKLPVSGIVEPNSRTDLDVLSKEAVNVATALGRNPAGQWRSLFTSAQFVSSSGGPWRYATFAAPNFGVEGAVASLDIDSGRPNAASVRQVRIDGVDHSALFTGFEELACATNCSAAAAVLQLSEDSGLVVQAWGQDRDDAEQAAIDLLEHLLPVSRADFEARAASFVDPSMTDGFRHGPDETVVAVVSALEEQLAEGWSFALIQTTAIAGDEPASTVSGQQDRTPQIQGLISGNQFGISVPEPGKSILIDSGDPDGPNGIRAQFWAYAVDGAADWASNGMIGSVQVGSFTGPCGVLVDPRSKTTYLAAAVPIGAIVDTTLPPTLTIDGQTIEFG